MTESGQGRRRTYLWWIGGSAALVLLVLLLAGTFKEKIGPDERPERAVPLLPFRQSQAVEAEVIEDELVEQFPGTVRAIHETIISSRILAVVQDVLKWPGDRVAAGDALMILDSRDLQAQEQQAREELAGVQAQLREAEASHERMRKVRGTGAISEQAFDQSAAAYEASQAALERARKRLEEAEVGLSYAILRAPFDAIVIDRFAEPGDIATAGAPLMKVYDPARMRLEAFVRESLAVKLEPGLAIDVQLDTLALRLEAKVEEIVPQAHAGSRSFLVKVGLPATEHVYPGMFGRLLLGVGTTRRVVVPEQAVVKVGQLSFVVMADESRRRRVVVPGQPIADGRVEILSGLDGGERILAPATSSR